ncbi:D-dopachrome decarboxylase-like [Ruditapes philippinarum]|uniref:D-dopachrome decarboxylase-like n=1 Tax=Ruditapes philippinarum TaxID=129788 RepID=UPI00295BAD57|nr:D-dopachrome decarboxylase-like [Ruditapes philippinarum]
MPICLLYTNLKRSDIDVNLEENVARCISETLNRPFEHVFVTLIAETPSFCAGSREPSMVCQVQSKEVFEDPSKISGYYPKFFEILKQATNIPGNRIVLSFQHVPDANADIGQ